MARFELFALEAVHYIRIKISYLNFDLDNSLTSRLLVNSTQCGHEFESRLIERSKLRLAPN